MSRVSIQPAFNPSQNWNGKSYPNAQQREHAYCVEWGTRANLLLKRKQRVYSHVAAKWIVIDEPSVYRRSYHDTWKEAVTAFADKMETLDKYDADDCIAISQTHTGRCIDRVRGSSDGWSGF